MQTQIKINEMKGTQFKKDLGLLRAIKSYQNKHKDQSGNFGFVLVIEKDKKEIWFRIDGDYNINQQIINLNLSFYGSYDPEHEKEYNKLSLYFQDIIKNGYQDKKEESKKETKNTPEQEAILSELRNFTGSESYFKSYTGLLYTEGIKYLADSLKAHWLVDLVGSYKNHANNKPFLVWRIEKEGNKAVVTAREDTNTPILIKQNIPYTDFKLNEYELYCIDGVLLLKSEY